VTGGHIAHAVHIMQSQKRGKTHRSLPSPVEGCRMSCAILCSAGQRYGKFLREGEQYAGFWFATGQEESGPMKRGMDAEGKGSSAMSCLDQIRPVLSVMYGTCPWIL
jgi:hypothetical protein